MVIIYGIILGISLSLFFSFGPSFFSMLQTSVHYGFRKAYPFPIGVSLSDVAIVLLMTTVLSGVDMSAVVHNVWVASIGGMVMMIFGFITFRKQVVDADQEGSVVRFRHADDPKWYSMLFKGFILNFFNPLIWVYWIAVVSVASGSFGLDTRDGQALLFFVGLLVAAAGFDLLKCRLASLLQHVLTAHRLNIFNKCTGVLLFGFALYLVVSMGYYQKHPEREKESRSTEMVHKLLEGADTATHAGHAALPTLPSLTDITTHTHRK